MNIIKKHLSNEKPYNWLDFIESGKKKFEGRLNKGYWKNLQIGDRLVIFNLEKELLIEIKNKYIFNNFGEAYDEFGHYLIPIKNITKKNVIDLYSKYYSNNDINKYGVVIVEIKKV